MSAPRTVCECANCAASGYQEPHNHPPKGWWSNLANYLCPRCYAEWQQTGLAFAAWLLEVSGKMAA